MTNQELWKTIKALRARIMGLERENRELKKQNKRYREYLELIRITGTHGKDISTGKIIRSNEANLAEEALEGDEK